MWIESRFYAVRRGPFSARTPWRGVVNVVTTDPGGDLHGYADGSYFGGGDEYRIKGGISGTLVEDRLAGSFSGVYSHYGGNVDNLFNGTTVNGYERYGGHAKFLYTPSDALRVTFNGDYLRSTDTVPTGVFATTCSDRVPDRGDRSKSGSGGRFGRCRRGAFLSERQYQR